MSLCSRCGLKKADGVCIGIAQGVCLPKQKRRRTEGVRPVVEPSSPGNLVRAFEVAMKKLPPTGRMTQRQRRRALAKRSYK